MRDRPSFTAQRVAVQRAQLERPSSSDGDPDAERRLYEGLANPLLFRPIDSGRMRRRTQWFDAATVDALSRGVQQIVIVGAGYDGRALRFKSESVRWIEVDGAPRWLADHVARAVLDGILTVAGETRRTEFRDGDAEQLLGATGWRVDRNDITRRTRIDGGSRGLLVLAAPRDDQP